MRVPTCRNDQGLRTEGLRREREARVCIDEGLIPGPLRWSELRREVEGISEKMLASTLRTLEADGLVAREAFPTIPPRVEYRLTTRGRELTDRLEPLMGWIAANADDILAPGS